MVEFNPREEDQELIYRRQPKSVVKFVDLFCGIGGFHEALKPNAECVFACDIDADCKKMYTKNFDMLPLGDIREIKTHIPPHDLLTAGFPCQPFSKSGSQLGFLDKIRGTLFEDIMDVIRVHKPKYVILENVRNLHKHDNGNTFAIIRGALLGEDYHVSEGILSPHNFGVPQFRERIFIVGINKEKVWNWKQFEFPQKGDYETHVNDLRDTKADKISLEDYRVSQTELDVFEHWSKFMRCLPEGVTPPSPTWGMEFGRSYPLKGIHPIQRRSRKELCNILLEEGIEISPDSPRSEILAKFPPYIRSMKKILPPWKIKFIDKNRIFWDKYGHMMPDGWLEQTHNLPLETFQKFEWHVGSSASREVMEHMIHTRPSGIRVSKLNRIPALVAMAQIPIIGPWGRRITEREAANAQSFKPEFILHKSRSVAYRQLGNSVNVKVVLQIFRKLLELEDTVDMFEEDERIIQYLPHPDYKE